jgi:hypothetical protein
MAELYDKTNNNIEPVSAYLNVGLDSENSIIIPQTPVITEPKTTPIITPIITPITPPTKKVLYKNQKIGLAIIIAVIVIFIIVFFTIRPSSLISKYENKSNFSNKDQFEEPTKNDYDIHYLVEQMIYKEFTPTDKKKYLNLPQTLKEQLMFDYLIDKI